jgi:hypothetical protein
MFWELPKFQTRSEQVRMTRLSVLTITMMLGFASLAAADNNAPQRIAWFGTLKSGLEEAKQSGRPVLLISAAPACLGVSGIW